MYAGIPRSIRTRIAICQNRLLLPLCLVKNIIAASNGTVIIVAASMPAGNSGRHLKWYVYNVAGACVLHIVDPERIVAGFVKCILLCWRCLLLSKSAVHCLIAL
jgi:hypothetical protein